MAVGKSVGMGPILPAASGYGLVMLIDHVLQRKGSAVVTVAAHDPVTHAVAILGDHNIGALVVTDDERRVVGIISERDVVRALASDGPATLDRTVGDLMTRTVTTCGRRATVDELMALMTEHRIRHVPVVDEGALVGIVSIGDVVKTRIGELETERETLHDYLSGRA
jgi:CBS domain-containing protein